MLEYRSIYIINNPSNLALLAPFLQHPRLTKILVLFPPQSYSRNIYCKKNNSARIIFFADSTFIQIQLLFKIVILKFDSRDLADCLFRCHQITLTRVLDLQVQLTLLLKPFCCACCYQSRLFLVVS